MLQRFFLLSFFVWSMGTVFAQECAPVSSEQVESDVFDAGLSGDMSMDDPELAQLLGQLTPDDLNTIEREQAALTLAQRMQVLLSVLKLRSSYVKSDVERHIFFHKKTYALTFVGAVVAVTGAVIVWYLLHKGKDSPDDSSGGNGI